MVAGGALNATKMGAASTKVRIKPSTGARDSTLNGIFPGGLRLRLIERAMPTPMQQKTVA
ncbi:hypothetical protein GCM10009107_06940 [Ideonella azotifigens]|uniref:Uncharacterized protein n=1 Tax=Ideonella azotifigens TaxID=513160 RepID=A0ABN1JMK8_9BURK